MFAVENLHLELSFDGIYLTLGLIILLFVSYFYYKYTLPPISNALRYFLIFVRTVALFLILLMFFEPEIIYDDVKTVLPRVDFFIDNSSSLAAEDSAKTVEELNRFISKINSSKKFIPEIYLFSDSVSKMKSENLLLNGNETNFANVLKKIISCEDSISAAVIITDGVITSGEEPTDKLNEITVPIYTLGTGDTVLTSNLILKNIYVNSVLYKNKSEQAVVSVKSEGNFKNKNASVNLYLNGRLNSRKTIKLSGGEFKKIKFDFIPRKTGKLKITAKVSFLPDEKNRTDNSKTVFADVLDKKKTILIVSDIPNYDVAFIKNVIETDTNFTVESIIDFGKEKKIPFGEKKKMLKNANAIFFIGYPSRRTDKQFFNLVKQSISNGKPYFIGLTAYENPNALTSIFPFIKINGSKPSVFKIEPIFQNSANELLEGMKSVSEINGKLPPFYFVENAQLTAKYFKPFMEASVNNVPIGKPVAFFGENQNQRATVFFVSGFYRWKLQSEKDLSREFDAFFVNISKWLTSNLNKQRFNIFTDKKTYTQNEEIEITAQVYNKYLEPESNAEIRVKITAAGIQRDLFLSSNGEEIYTASIGNLPPAEYSISATATANSEKLYSNAEFTVTAINIEKATAHLNKNLLQKISYKTGGKYFPFTQNDSVLSVPTKNLHKTEIRKKNRIIFFSRKDILFFIILFFSIEWIFRKRKGLL